jgi:hypothetical protein
MKITYALEAYHRERANRAERRAIEEIIVAFADWWIDHDFTTNYFGNCCWWLKTNHAHSTAFFLYLTALAGAFSKRAKYTRAFAHCLNFRATLIHGKGDHANSCNIAIECAERLCELKPALAPFWRRSVLRQIGFSLEALQADGSVSLPSLATRFQQGARIAASLAVAHRLFPKLGFGARVFPLLRKYSRREHFHHVTRGQKRIHPLLQRPDYIHSFSAQEHASWLRAYWMMPCRKQRHV